MAWVWAAAAAMVTFPGISVKGVLPGPVLPVHSRSVAVLDVLLTVLRRFLVRSRRVSILVSGVIAAASQIDLVVLEVVVVLPAELHAGADVSHRVATSA